MLEIATRPIARKGAIFGGPTTNLQNECSRSRLVVTPRETAMSVGKVFKFYRTFALYNKEDFTAEEQQAFAEGVEHALKKGLLRENPYAQNSSVDASVAWECGYCVVRNEEDHLDAEWRMVQLGRVGGG